jgi:hypothetical protein
MNNRAVNIWLFCPSAKFLIKVCPGENSSGIFNNLNVRQGTILCCNMQIMVSLLHRLSAPYMLVRGNIILYFTLLLYCSICTAKNTSHILREQDARLYLVGRDAKIRPR